MEPTPIAPEAAYLSQKIMIYVYLFILIVLYFLPTIAAYKNENCNNTQLIAVLNVLFGWSIIGWIIPLMMALWQPPKKS